MDTFAHNDPNTQGEDRQTTYALLSTPGRVTLWLLRRQQALIVNGWAAIAPGG